MSMGIISRIINLCNVKIKRVITLFLFVFTTLLGAFSQPVWNSGPTVTPNPISFDLDFNLDRASNVYYFVMPGDYSPVTPTSVRSYANQPLPYGAVVANGQINYTSGDYSTVIYGELSNLSAGTQYTIQLVAEDQAVPGSFTVVSKITFYTAPCPEVYFDNGLQQFGNCVNLGASKRFNMYPDPDPNISGILKGTEWVINWGDGTIYNYVSAFDGDYPDLASRSHTYDTANDCNYVFTCAARNPCGKTFSPQYVAIVHGRDIPLDGDGNLEIVNNADGSNLIQVCAGTETIITVRDNSIWNCQNPVVPGGLVAVPNDDPRNIEWLYGQDPIGNITNTISGTVFVAGLGDAPQSSGRFSPTPYGPSSLAQSVTIPATCQAGEYFRIYLKNWNKCNWTDPEYVSTYIDILVIAAPDAPTVPNKTICFGGDRELVVTSTPVGTIRWYSDAALTTMVAENTTNFTPPYTGPGSVSYWVTDQSTSGIECMSPATMVTLTINPIPSTPSISRSGPDFCYDGSSSVVLTANPNDPPVITGYQWYRNGSAIGGETSSTITLSTVAQSGTYTVRTFGIADTWCPSELSNAITVNIWPLATVTTQPSDRDVCENGSTSFTMTAGGAARTYRWQRRIGAGAWTNITGSSNPDDGCTYSGYTTPTLGIASADMLQDGYQYRMRLTTTAGGCVTYSNPATLNVNPLATINTQPANTSVCELGNTSFSVAASVIGGSSITAYQWQRYNGSSWSNITGATSPNDGCTYSGYNTATLNITNAVAGITSYRYRVRITTTGNCSRTSDSGVLTVNRLADITGQPPNRAICAETNTTFTVTDDGNPAVTNHQWQRWDGSSWSDITGATSPNDGCSYGGYNSGTLTLTNVPAGMTNYRYRCVLTTTGPCSITSNYGTLTVYPLATTTNPVNQSVCHGSATSFSITAGGAPGSIRWQRSNNGGSTWVNITGASNPGDGCTYSAYITSSLGISNAQLSMDNYQYRAVLTTTSGGCETFSGAAILTVNPLPVPTINGPNSVCIASVGNVYVTEAGMTNYVWSVSAGGTITSGGGPGNNTVTVTWNAPGTQSVSVNYTNGNNCTGASPTVYSVDVGAPPSDATLTGSGDDCYGDANSWIRSVITSGAPPYTIEYTRNGILQPDITNYTSGSNYDLGMLAPGTYTYEITEVRDLCGSTVPSASLPDPYTIVIAPIPDISATSPNTQTICSDGSAIITLNSTVNNTIFEYSVSSSPAGGYSWATGKDPAGGSVTDSDGDGTETLTRQLQHDNNSAVTVTYTITPKGPGATECPGSSITRTVIVNPTPAITNMTSLICSGGSFALTPANVTNGVVPAGTTYTWGPPSVTGGITGGAGGSGAIITGTLANMSGSNQTATYTVTPTSGSCTGANFTVTVTVQSQPVGADDDAEACSNEQVNYDLQNNIDNLGNGQVADFTWIAADNPNVTGESFVNKSGDIIDDAILNITGTDQDVIYTVTPTGENGCTGSSFEITVTVKSEPLGDDASTLTCSDIALNYNLQTANIDVLGNSQEADFSWIAAENESVERESTTAQSGNIINDNINNVSGIDQIVIYTVTPTGVNGCVGDPFQVEATIQSEPLGADDAIETCSGTALNYNLQTSNINLLGNGQASNFTWVATDNSVVSGESFGSQSGGSITDNLINLTGTDQIVEYTVTPTGTNGCTGNPFTVSVTVKSQPVGADDVAEACSNEQVNYDLQDNINDSGNGQAATFIWIAADNTDVTGASLSNQTGSIIDDAIINITGTDQDVIYTVTPTGTDGGCTGNSFQVTVTVKSQPRGDDDNAGPFCSDETVNYDLQDNIDDLGNGQTATFTWIAANNPNVEGESYNENKSGGIIDDAIINTSGTDQDVIYTVTPTGTNGCEGNSFEVTVTVRSEPEGAHDDLLICSGSPLSYDLQTENIDVLGNGQAATFSWVAGANFNVSDETTDAQTTGSITDVLTNITGGEEIVTYMVTPTGINLCTGETFTVSVTVKPEPVITPDQNVPVCSNNQMDYEILLKNFSDPATDGVTFTWDAPVLSPSDPAFTGGTARSTASSDNITDTFVNTTGSLGTATYTITPYRDGCAGDPVTLTVTVGAEPVLDPNLDKFACSGQPVELTLKEAAGSVVPTYYNITGRTLSPGLTVTVPADTADLPKADALAGYLFNDVYINTTGVNQTVTYHVQPVLVPDCFGDFVDVVVTIRPQVIAGAITGDDEICYGEDAPVISNVVNGSGGDGIIEYLWYYTEDMSATPGDPGWTEITGATGTSYDPGILFATTQFVRKANDGSCPDEVYTNPVTITVNPLPVTSPISGESLLCVGAFNKIYQVTNTPGSTYNWSLPPALTLLSPQGLNFIIVEATGPTNPGDVITVTETLSSSTGCVGIPVEFPITVVEKVPGFVVSGPLNVCQGDSGIIYSVPWNEGSSYSWSIPAGAYITSEPDSNEIAVTFNMAISGQVSVVETSNSVCTTIHLPISVTAHALPNVYNVSASQFYCFGTGGVTVTLSGSQSGVNYQLLKDGVPEGAEVAGTGAALTWDNMTAGIYTVRATNAAPPNCTRMMNGAVNVQENPEILITSIDVTEPNCYGGTDGLLVINASGGFPPVSTLTYSIDGGTTFVASNTFNVGAGTYDVVVKDIMNCTATAAPVTVGQPTELLITSVDVSLPIDCYGFATGSVRVDVTGGTPDYSYEWYAEASMSTPIPGQTNAEASGLPAGTYYVKVTDANGCFKTGSVVLPQPSQITATAAITSNFSGSPISCNGASNAEITVTASGGTGVLSYVLDQDPGNVTGAGSGVFTGVGPGTWTVTVTDVNLCTQVTNQVIVTEPSVITASAEVTSDYNGSDVSCNGASDGRITVTASGGTGTLSYVLDQDPSNVTGSITGIFTGLPAGTYTITVRDKNSCDEVTAPVTINDPTLINVNAFVSSNYNGSDVTCYGVPDGEITATATGGTGTLNYSIVQMPGNMTGSSSGIFTGIPAGTYNVRVTDINGCNVVSPDIVIQNPDPVTASGTVSSDYHGSQVSCFGSADGEITVTASGGTGTLTYVLDQDPANITGEATGVFTGLLAGNYTVTVSDENGCSGKTPMITISNPPAITAIASISSNYNGSHISCNGMADGEISVTASGGTGALIYVLDQDPGNITGETTGIFTDLVAGTYTVTVTDLNMCSFTTVPVTLSEPSVLTATAEVTSNYYGSQLSCHDASDGRISVTASGGTGALTYECVEIPSNTSGELTGIFTGLPEGTYSFIVTDVNGCFTTTVPVTITAPPALTLTVNVTSDYNGQNISCNGASDGKAEAVAGGGTGVYFYSWYSDAAMTVPIGQLTAEAINLSAGDYYVRVMDINGCMITGDVTLSEPVALDASILSQTDVLCYNNATGEIIVEAVAGTGTPPYQYSISGGASWDASGTYSSLAAASYTVLVRDANDCIKQIPVIITQPSQLTASITSVTNVSCNGGNNGIVTVEATAGSGTSPYTYSIDGGANWQIDGTFPGLSAGSYNVTVRDNNNCMVIIPVMITEPPLLQLTASPDILLDCNGDQDGTGTFNAAGGTMPYTFTVQDNTSSATFAVPGFNYYTFFNAGAGSITVRVTDANGCYREATINITEPPELLPGTIESDQVLCAGDNPGTITELSPATGGPGAISYQWQYATDSLGTYFNIAMANGNEYTPPVNATSTLYYRRMASSGICAPVYSDTVEIKVNARPIAILSGGATICPGDSAILQIELPSGTPPYDVVIENFGAVTDYRSEDTVYVKPLITTTYTLTSVVDSNGCAITTGSPNLMGSATINVRDLPVITEDPADTTVCEYGMVTFEVEASGSDLIYQWYVDDGSGPVAVTDGGIYFGAQTRELYLFGTTRDMDGYVYYADVTTCSTTVTSATATLYVNTVPEIVSQPTDTTICATWDASFHVSATGTGLTFQWQRNSGGSFVDIEDIDNFSGSNDSVLVITDAPASFNNNIFRVIVEGVCGVPVYSNFVILRVNVTPVITINPADKAICAGGGPVYFIANGSGMIDSLRWQVSEGGTGPWTDIYDNAVYSGATTQQLALVTVPDSYSTNQYRLAVKSYCGTVYSDVATLTVHPNPVVNFASDTLFACGGVTMPVDPAPSGGSGIWDQHTWTGDIGPLSNYFVEVPDFNSMLSGPYNLNYRVKDSNGCYGDGSVVVSVDSPDASFTQDLSIMCTPDTVTFYKDMTGISGFTWDFGDGSPVNTVDANPVHVFINSNATAIEYYNVSLTVVSESGCSATYSQMTTVYPAIDATFTSSADTVCSGSMVVFTALSGANNYYWDYGDGSEGPGSYISQHLYVNTGIAPETHTVTLTTTSFYGCVDVKTLDIVVMPVPLPQFSAAPTPQTFDPAGNEVIFTNETNPGTWNYTWKFGDGYTSTEESPAHTYTGIGTYNVTLIVDNVNCVDSVTHQINILPLAPVATFDSIPSGCAPWQISPVNTSLNTETPGTTYRWDFGDGSYSTAKNPTYTYYTPGVYRVELTVTGPGGVSVYSQVVESYRSPQAYFEVSPSLVFVNDESVRCFNLTQYADYYLWEFGDGDT